MKSEEIKALCSFVDCVSKDLINSSIYLDTYQLKLNSIHLEIYGRFCDRIKILLNIDFTDSISFKKFIKEWCNLSKFGNNLRFKQLHIEYKDLFLDVNSYLLSYPTQTDLFFGSIELGIKNYTLLRINENQHK